MTKIGLRRDKRIIETQWLRNIGRSIHMEPRKSGFNYRARAKTKHPSFWLHNQGQPFLLLFSRKLSVFGENVVNSNRRSKGRQLLQNGAYLLEWCAEDFWRVAVRKTFSVETLRHKTIQTSIAGSAAAASALETSKGVSKRAF